MTPTSVLEIERKFLVASVSPVLLVEAAETRLLTQGYLAFADAAARRAEVRIRRVANHPQSARLTVKWGSGLSRMELETPVADDFAAQVMTRVLASVTKRRYRVGAWEIDVYAYLPNSTGTGPLVVAEVELPTADAPLPPAPAGLTLDREVTGEHAFGNAQLAQEEQRLRGLGLLRDLPEHLRRPLL